MIAVQRASVQVVPRPMAYYAPASDYFPIAAAADGPHAPPCECRIWIYDASLFLRFEGLGLAGDDLAVPADETHDQLEVLAAQIEFIRPAMTHAVSPADQRLPPRQEIHSLIRRVLPFLNERAMYLSIAVQRRFVQVG